MGVPHLPPDDPRDAQIADLQTQIAELRATNAQLRARIAAVAAAQTPALSPPDPPPADASRPLRRTARLLFAFICGQYLLLGAVLGVATFLFAPELQASAPVQRGFLVQSFADALTSARVAGISLLLAGGLVWLFRAPVERYILGVLADFPPLLAGLRTRVRTLLRREQRVYLVGLVLIFALAVAMRLVYLNQPMRYDEAYTCFTYACGHSIVAPLALYYDPNNHVLHSILVNLAWQVGAWLGVFGPWVLRLPALLAGLLIVPAAYIWVRMVYNKHAALLAAALVAVSSILIEYATNARGYPLIGLCFLLLLILAEGIRRSSNRAAWFLFAVVGALGFFTIPVMLYPFGIAVTWLVLTLAVGDSPGPRRVGGRRLLAALLVTGVLTVELYLPLLIVSGWRQLLANPYVASLPWNVFFGDALRANLIDNWLSWTRDLPLIVTQGLVVGVAVALIGHWWMARGRVPVLLAVVIWSVPVLLVQRVLPLTRVWLFLLPLGLGLAAAGLVFLGQLVVGRLTQLRALAPPALTVGVLGLAAGLAGNVLQAGSIYASNPTGHDANAIVLFLKDYLRPGDGVLSLAPENYVLSYYFSLDSVPMDDYFQWTGKPRVIIVVSDREYTLDAALSSSGVPAGAYSAPQLIHKYDFASVYEIQAKTAP